MNKTNLSKIVVSSILLLSLLVTMISCGDGGGSDTTLTTGSQNGVGDKVLAFDREDNEKAEINVLYRGIMMNSFSEKNWMAH